MPNSNSNCRYGLQAERKVQSMLNLVKLMIGFECQDIEDATEAGEARALLLRRNVLLEFCNTRMISLQSKKREVSHWWSSSMRTRNRLHKAACLHAMGMVDSVSRCSNWSRSQSRFSQKSLRIRPSTSPIVSGAEGSPESRRTISDSAISQNSTMRQHNPSASSRAHSRGTISTSEASSVATDSNGGDSNACESSAISASGSEIVVRGCTTASETQTAGRYHLLPWLRDRDGGSEVSGSHRGRQIGTWEDIKPEAHPEANDECSFVSTRRIFKTGAKAKRLNKFVSGGYNLMSSYRKPHHKTRKPWGTRGDSRNSSPVSSGRSSRSSNSVLGDPSSSAHIAAALERRNTLPEFTGTKSILRKHSKRVELPEGPNPDDPGDGGERSAFGAGDEMEGGPIKPGHVRFSLSRPRSKVIIHSFTRSFIHSFCYPVNTTSTHVCFIHSPIYLIFCLFVLSRTQPIVHSFAEAPRHTWGSQS
eukprot:GHVU01005563.1.p1 GENE.GHVU01005563.1~~GHVU01005563.1.p1  ORF type:complete len:476 (+),score=23.24 GHVU01005563.1:217-1644(+)